MNFYGLISHQISSEKVIGIKRNNKIYFFYMQARFYKLFRKYLYVGNYISFVYNSEYIEQKGKVLAYQIMYITKIFVPNKYSPHIYYDIDNINQSLYGFLDSLENLLFIDLEMTMPNYVNRQNTEFTPEIVQAAFILVNNDTVIQRERFDIKPSKSRYVNSRTRKFLGINKREFTGINYYKFYNIFKKYIQKYQPAIIVWGKYDIICLNNSYNINGVASLAKYCRFIDLNSLIKNYYALKTDPGLFKMYQYYNKDFEKSQQHDALEDAIITYKVFCSFKEDVKHNLKMGE